MTASAMVALGARPPFAARSFESDFLSAALAVLRNEGDFGKRPVGAETAGIDQVSMLTAEDDEMEVTDGRIGHNGNRGPQAASDVRGFGTGDNVDLAVEEEGEARQASAATDRVDRPG
jgi:hypothetical protein